MPPAPAPEISQVFALLHQWGIHTLGELAALDREQLRLRLGPIAARLWDQATGKSTRLLRLVRPTEIFAEQIEFEHEIETTEPLLFILRRFLEQLERRLAVHYLVAAELTFQLTFTDKSRYEHRFQIPDPTHSVEILFRLLQSHLENFRAEYPIVAVALALQPARAARQQFDLFETPLRDPSRLQETLTRLTGLLGAERVGTPVLEDSHRPDTFQLQPFSWQPAASPNESSEIIGPALRRFRLSVESLGEERVIAREGPYFSSGDWWDGKKWQHVEWDLQLDNNVLQRAQKLGDNWVVDGVYD
jgi:protein ImuB